MQSLPISVPSFEHINVDTAVQSKRHETGSFKIV